MISLGVIFVISILFIVSGNIFSFIVLVLLLGILSFVLIHFGFIKIDTSNNQIDITYFPVPEPPRPTGAESKSSAVGTPPPSSEVHTDEVFYVADNTFTFDKAENVCKAYGAELATYSQVEQAYNSGAEWCGYGWSVGGLALFPTQKDSWEKRQMNETSEAKRQMCGRPGINGGYFDPSMKFGVNCYGKKPDKKKTDETEDKKRSTPEDREIGYLRDNLGNMLVLPFNKSAWSESERAPPPPPPPTSNIVDSTTNTGSLGTVPPAGTQGPRTVSQNTAAAVRGVGSAAVGVVGHVGSGVSQFLKDLVNV
jgi:hypothetical protein